MKDNQTQWGHYQKNRLFLLRERLKSLGYTVIHSYRNSTPEESLWFLKRGDNFGTMWWAQYNMILEEVVKTCHPNNTDVCSKVHAIMADRRRYG